MAVFAKHCPNVKVIVAGIFIFINVIDFFSLV